MLVGGRWKDFRIGVDIPPAASSNGTICAGIPLPLLSRGNEFAEVIAAAEEMLPGTGVEDEGGGIRDVACGGKESGSCAIP